MAHSLKIGEASKEEKSGGNRGLSILDFIMRIVASVGTLISAIVMATTNESLPFSTPFFRFGAEYDDLPTFSIFVFVNGVVCAYLVLSLVLSIIHIVRSGARKSRMILIIFDTAMLAVLTAGASAAAAIVYLVHAMLAVLTGGASAAATIVYLAHRGNTRTNWFAICLQYNSFCERISGSLIGSFIAILALTLLIISSAVAVSRN